MVLEQGVSELKAACDDHVAGYLLRQLRNPPHHIPGEHPSVVPGGVPESRGNNILGLAIERVRQGAAPGWPACGQEVVGPSPQQHGRGTERLLERDGACFFTTAIADATDPTAVPEAFDAGRVFDHPVESDVFADDQPSHCLPLRRTSCMLCVAA